MLLYKIINDMSEKVSEPINKPINKHRLKQRVARELKRLDEEYSRTVMLYEKNKTSHSRSFNK